MTSVAATWNSPIITRTSWPSVHTYARHAWLAKNSHVWIFFFFWVQQLFLLITLFAFRAGPGTFLGDMTVPLGPMDSQKLMSMSGGLDKVCGPRGHHAFSRKMWKCQKLGSKNEKMPAVCTILPLEGWNFVKIKFWLKSMGTQKIKSLLCIEADIRPIQAKTHIWGCRGPRCSFPIFSCKN